MDDFTRYHKFHRMVMTYGEAEKYIKVGWTLESVRPVLLRGINKEFEECTLVWDRDDTPITPDDLD